ncbi:uncharacterized protein PRCAT00000041001 [Priceomyces carsonii]|uniref:uncharacterized protein n=1 Tax=Priceomyces carsonii TaxID=28549 RepID=UPI002EDA924E|nr:unnamed protein product [Priceomyces carsonii]
MRILNTLMPWAIAGSIVSASELEGSRNFKRNVQYVTQVTTVNMDLAAFLEGLIGTPTSSTTEVVPSTFSTTSTTEAATEAVSTSSPSTTKTSENLRSFWAQLLGWGSDDGGSSSSSLTTTSLTASSAATGAGSDTTEATDIAYTTSITSASIPNAYTTTSDTETSTGSSGSTPSSSGSSSGASIYVPNSAGITYSPYTESGSCKTASEVKSDMEKLSGVGMIRLYSVDCSGINNVLAALPSGAKLFLGVWNIDYNDLTTDLQTMKEAVESSSEGWDAVHTISIGNERVNSGLSSVSEVVTAVQNARKWLKANAADFSGKVVTVDTLVAVMDNTDLCDASDYLTVNCHPYWDGSVLPSNSGTWLEQQISDLKSTCNNGKEIFITETGWPTEGQTNGKCVPSEANQLAAIKDIVSKVGDQTLLFTMYNDYWKDPGDMDVEQYWGIFGNPSA